MPRLQASSNPDQLVPYGVNTADNRLTFRERLMKRFAAHEWVRVINIDNEAFTWQYMPEHNEKFEFTPDPMKITYRGDPEMYILSPGEDEVIIGENAFVMIEALYKKVISKRVIAKSPNMQPGQARAFNWTDGIAQDELIDRIFLGKESPRFSTDEPRVDALIGTPAPFKGGGEYYEPQTPNANQVAKDLGLDDPQPVKASAGSKQKAL